MTDDSRIGDLLRDLTAPPSVGDPVARVRTRRRRLDRTRGALAVSVAVVAVLGLVAATQAVPRRDAPVAEAGVVPWALRLAPVPEPFLGPRSAPTGTPACRAQDVTLEAGDLVRQPTGGEARLPAVQLTLLLRNDGPACTLETKAQGRVLDERGRALPLPSRFGEALPGYAPIPPLEPGATASTRLSFSSHCGDDPGRWRAEVDLADGPVDVSAPGDDPAVPPCAAGSDGSAYGLGTWTLLNAAGQPAADPQSALVGTVTGDDRAPFGGVLHQVLRLQNSTRGPIALDPCPVFVWSVDEDGPGSFHAATPRLSLNCQDAPDAVPAGGSVSFALELALSPALVDGALQPGRWFVTPGFGVEPYPVTVLPPEPAAAPDPAPCTWVPMPGATPRVPGLPAPTASRADRTAVLRTNRGDVTVALEAGRAPCAVAAFAFLADGGFWDDQSCYALSLKPAQFRHLDCGANEAEPLKAGFAFPSEARDGQDYPRGTVVLSSTDSVLDAGSVRVLFGQATTYQDSFVVLGHVTAGMDVVDEVAAGGQRDGDYGGPALPLRVQHVTVMG